MSANQTAARWRGAESSTQRGEAIHYSLRLSSPCSLDFLTDLLEASHECLERICRRGAGPVPIWMRIQEKDSFLRLAAQQQIGAVVFYLKWRRESSRVPAGLP